MGARRIVVARVVVAVVVVAVVGILAVWHVRPVAAACADAVQEARATSFTGEVLEELPYDETLLMRRWTLEAPDGEQRVVNVVAPRRGSAVEVEDAYAGPYPIVGQTDRVNGWSYDAASSIFLNGCRPHLITVLAIDPARGDGTGAWVPLGAAAVLGVGLIAARARRRQRSVAIRR